MQMNMVKLPTKQADLYLRTVKGHFATNHSHINYYIDVTMQKARLSEAKRSLRRWLPTIAATRLSIPFCAWTVRK